MQGLQEESGHPRPLVFLGFKESGDLIHQPAQMAIPHRTDFLEWMQIHPGPESELVA